MKAPEGMQNMTKEDSAIANDVTPPENSRCENENQNPDGSAGPIPDGMSAQRVFKKVSPNQKLTLYLSSRDLVVSPEGIDRITGVLLVDPEFVEERKVYGQVTLTFRYGREDEEVMGLKFCNEAIMCLCLLYPPNPIMWENTTPLQEALIKRLGVNAHPFSMEITPLAPPSVQLVPAKEYNGAPIGTSYDIRAYVDRVDEKLHRRSTIRMGIRVVQRAFAPPSPHMYVPGGEGRTCKERAKQNRKALLFGYKSAPMETTCPKSEKESTNLHILGQLENQDARPLEKPRKSVVMGDTFGDKLAYSRAVLEMDVDKGLDGSGTEGRELQGNEETNQTFGPEKENDAGNVENKAVTEKTISELFHNSCGGKRPSLAAYLAGVPAPKACTEKYYLLSEGKICLMATLDKAIYSHGEEVRVSVSIENNSSKTVKRLKVFIVQHVDVCMFSNGKFKNVVAMLDPKENCSIHSGRTFEKTFSLIPMKSTTKNWIALEESYNKAGTSLASTVTSTMNNPDDRNVFAIYVSYYVKVKLLVNRMGGDLSLKLPFTLMHTCCDLDHTETLSRVKPTPTTDEVQRDAKSPGVSPSRDIDKDFPTPTTSSALTQCPEEVKPEKDGT